MTLILQLAFFIFLSVLALYAYALHHSKFFRKRGVPGPAPALFSGNLASVFGSRPAIFRLSEWTEQFGPVYGMLQGWVPRLIVAEPKMAHELLVTKFDYFHGRNHSPMLGNVDTEKLTHLFSAQGARWKRLRSIANPAFSTTNIKKMMPVMDDSIRKTVEFLEQARQQSGPIDLHRYFIEMTFDVIARVAMGQPDSRQFQNDYTQPCIECLQRFNNRFLDWYAWLAPALARNVLRPLAMFTGRLLNDPLVLLINKITEAVLKRKRELEEDIKQGVEERQANDFIDLFLQVELSYQIDEQKSGVFDAKAQRVEKKNCLEEVVMQCIVFLIAGFDTTANSLSIVGHNLALYPDVQRKLQEEIDTICVDETPTYEQLGQLKYAQSVIKESIRLRPIAGSVMNRICAETTTLGDYTVEKGTAVQLDVISIHRNKGVWGEDADQFRPERWLTEEGHLQQHQHFYAFGGGPRTCIGMRFALLEEKMALTRILRKFNIVRLPQTETELRFTGQVVLNPVAVTVGLEPRE